MRIAGGALIRFTLATVTRQAATARRADAPEFGERHHPGTAIFLMADPNAVPPTLLHNLKRNKDSDVNKKVVQGGHDLCEKD